MLIRCWGSRGSVPVSGAEFSRYGGDTTCVEVVSAAGDIVLLDAGTGIRNFSDRYAETAAKSVIHIVFTHAHFDHMIGIPFFSPIHDDRAEIHIHGCSCGSDSLETALRKFMRPPYFPVDFGALTANIVFHEIVGAPFQIGALKFIPIRLNHPNGGCGFRIEEKDKAFVFLTDNELEYGQPGFDVEYFEEFCANADLLIHDGEYTDEEYPRFQSWGHSRYTDAVRLAMKANAKRIGLFHINSRRTDDQMDAIVEHAKSIIAENGATTECYGVGTGFEMEI